jgi:hypothetical protein
MVCPLIYSTDLTVLRLLASFDTAGEVENGREAGFMGASMSRRGETFRAPFL